MTRSILLLSLLVPLSAWAEDAAPAASEAPGTAQADAGDAATDEDPYLWLEDVTGDRSLDWVRAQNEISGAELTGREDFAPLEARLLAILDSDERIAYPDPMGKKYYYNFWTDAQHVRGIWRRTTPKEYAKTSPKWETILDIDALGATEGESWVWDGASCVKPDYNRCLISLSRGGSDAAVVREFDIKSRSFVDGGFFVPEAKSDVTWIDRDHIFVGTDFGEGSLTDSGYPRIVKRWTRGTPLADAEVIYDASTEDVWVGAFHDDAKGFERDGVARGIDFFTNEVHLIIDGELVRIDKPDDASVSFWRDWLLLELRKDWTVADKTYKAGSLLAIHEDAFLAGDRSFDVLFEPGERTSLAGFNNTRSHLVLNELDNVRNRLTVLTPGKDGWTRAPMAGLPELATVSAWAVDADRSDDVFLTVTDYLTPTSLLQATIGGSGPRQLKTTPAWFDAEGLVTTQHEATSADGTKIPYFQVSVAGLPADGTAATLLYGYGGFEVSLLPRYSGAAGAAWLEKGGVYVVANIRGGGEFGPRWHQAALKENRNKAYEDFAAVAEDLIARGVTSPEHLGIQGGSNGGLLMGNMTVMYPQLFKAVVCQVPLLDMKRFNKLLAGASWMGEYGDPDDPDQWAWLQRYSPYQNVSADVDYPRVLFTTSTRDDRVHPGHARKMAARMLEQGHDILYFENIEGGHGGAADSKQRAHMTALAYAFLWSELQ